MKIIPPTKIYVDISKIHGYGVFAKEKISKGEIFEECPLLDLGIPYGHSTHVLIDYRFNWPQGEVVWQKQVISWGYGSLYNHSDSPNAYWRSSKNNNTFEFVATKDINPDEEILVYYGDENYWADGRLHTQIV